MRIDLEIPLRLEECISAMNGRGAIQDVTIRTLVTDSREAICGDLFIALAKEKKDRIAYVKEARSFGAITVSEEYADLSVTDTEEALLSLASLYRSRLTRLVSVVGITGSVGKTTVKEFIACLLSESYRVHATPGNYNNAIGLSISMLTAPADTEVLVLEMGMNHSGEIRRLNEHACVDIGVITSVGTAHIGELGSRENIARAKRELLEHGAKAIIPYGEPLLSGIIGATTFSERDEGADVYFSKMKNIGGGYNVNIEQKGYRSISANLNVTGRQNAANLLPAIAVCRELNLMDSDIARRISSISNVNIRQNIEKCSKFFILEDSYNASAESMLPAFEQLYEEIGFGERCALLGDILELGSAGESIHFRLGYEIGARKPRSLFLCGDYAVHYAEGALSAALEKDRIHIFAPKDAEECATCVLSDMREGELLLAKGSHKSAIPRVLRFLKERGR